MNTENIDVHKKADEWYNQAVIPCRREMQQDICAWHKETDEQFREVITNGFFYGYMQALDDMKNEVDQLQKQLEYYQGKEIRDGWREWAATAPQRHREIQESFLRKEAGL